MSGSFRLLSLAIIALAAGCSSDTAKRTAYETLQNIHEQECLNNPSLKCEKREYYDDYERKRKALESAE
jgi:hypothetical protein